VIRRAVAMAALTSLCGCYHYHFFQCHDDKWGTGGKLTSDLRDPTVAQSRYANATQLLDEMKECRNDESTYMPADNKNGIQQAIYPMSKSASYAARYVELGQVYEKGGRFDEGALAYWSALMLTHHTYAERPSREEIKVAAFDGLARIAKAQGQAGWANLLAFCADLSDGYLKSPVSDADSERFMSERNRIDQGVRESIEAENAANQALAMQSFGMRMQAQSGGMSLAQAANGLVDLTAQRSQIDSATESANARTSDAASGLGVALTDDVSEIETGKSFVWAHVASYLKADARRTLRRIEKAAEAAQWTSVSEIVSKLSDPSDPTDEELEALAKALHDVEVQAVRETRRRSTSASTALGEQSVSKPVN
jgi:hypothetical protein